MDGKHAISPGWVVKGTHSSFRRDERGQTVVLVALLLATLTGFTALAVDAGRFYMERRFLQNAADAAALACAQKLTAGGSTGAAETAARTLLESYNLIGSPTGTGATVAATPVYNGWFNGDSSGADRRNLADGIAASTNNCRVALRATVRMLFIPIVNPGLATLQVPANAHAKAKGGMLPVVVNRFDNPPGPGGNFHDYARREAEDNACDDNDANGDEGVCNWATETWPGRERVIVGQGYQSSDSDFRGFIALDVRNFTDTNPVTGEPVHNFYNGTAGMSTNALKDREAGYLMGGYPGPDLETYDPNANPAQKGLQVSTMSGNNTGIAVTNMKKAFRPGDKVLVQLFNGVVQEIPDFTINSPTPIEVTSPQPDQNGPTFRVGANQNFRAANNLVTLQMARDTFNGSSSDTPAGLHGPTTQNAQFRFDPGSTDPPLGACPNAGPLGFSGGCFTPAGGAGTLVTMKNVEVDAGVASGIYSLIIKGIGYKPDGTLISTKQSYVPLEVGSVNRDFSMAFPGTSVDVTNAGDPATFTFQLTTGGGSNAWCSSCVSPTHDVSFAIDRNSCTAPDIELKDSTGVTDCRSVPISPTSAIPASGPNPPTVTITVPTTGLATGAYTFVLRGRGTNADGQPVAHVQPLTVNVATTGGAARKYVNVHGYAVFKVVTCTGNDSNTVCGRAVSGKANSPDDPAVAIGKKSGLLPWDVCASNPPCQ